MSGMEMISLKSPSQIERMRRAGRLTAQARALAGSLIRPGITTHEIDHEVRKFIESHGGKPSFLGYGGFTGSACISVNEVVIHGIPGPLKLKEGDIVSVDVGAFVDGFHGDCAATFPCGQVRRRGHGAYPHHRAELLGGHQAGPRRQPGVRHLPRGAAVRGVPRLLRVCGTSWATAWAPGSTRPRRCPTSAPPATVPGSSRA